MKHNIENYDNMTIEEKLAALEAYEPDMSGFISKATFDKTASELAAAKKSLKEKMTQDEQAAAQQAEALAAMQAELEELKAEKSISEYTAQFLAIGYDEALAKNTASALHKGDMATMFANHARFVASCEKTLKAELLKNTPTPPAGEGNDKKTKEDFQKMTLVEKQKFALENPERYKELYGGN